MQKTNEWRGHSVQRPATSLVSRADMSLPPRIAECAGVVHQWILKGRFEPDRLRQFDEHTAGYTVENDRVYFSHGQWDFTDDNDVLIRGGAFEIARCFYWRAFGDGANINPIPKTNKILRHFNIRDPQKTKGIAEWAQWVSTSVEPGLDWRDRLYWEQRLAGWLSSLEQGLDLVKGENIYIVNSRRIISLLMSLPSERRQYSSHHYDLIKMIAPQLLEIPVNPPDPVRYRLSLRMKQMTSVPPTQLTKKIVRHLARLIGT